MKKFENKKLLILGGSTPSIDIVKAAQEMGVHTIVADYYDVKRSPAKLVADEMWNDDIFDTDLIVRKIKEKCIDGILTGFTDSYLPQYQKLCEQTALPCYATKEVFELTMDKARFKQLCRDNDIPVIPEYDLATFNPKIINENHKVIVKPVDNSGSRGVVLCSKPEDFQRCLDYALSFSEKKQVVIEQYMEMDSISLSYTIQDGIVSLSTTDDRYIHKSKSGSSVTQCGIYPSKYTDAYIEKIDSKMKRMYEKAGLKNGVLAVQFFTNGTEFYVMEMGHRLTGGQHYTYTMAENGISSLCQLIQFAVTGSMADFSIAEIDNARFKHVYCHLFILGHKARIDKIEGYDFLCNMPETINVQQMKQVGDEIGEEGTAAQKVAGVHLKVDNTAHLKRVLDDVKEHFHIYDAEGNDLTIMFNKDRI